MAFEQLPLAPWLSRHRHCGVEQGHLVQQSFSDAYLAHLTAPHLFSFPRSNLLSLLPLRPQVLGGTTLNVRNAPSPACTASLAIAEQVVDVAEVDFSWKGGKA